MPSTRRPDEPRPDHGFGPLTEDLRRVLRTELLRDTCSAAAIARLFSMHRRTLNRHLRMEGLAFRQVANEIRFEIACELLANTDMALGQIAAVLRYSELSAFTRAFRRWSGQTPSAWRSSSSACGKSRPLRKSDDPHPEQDHGRPLQPDAVTLPIQIMRRRAFWSSGPTDRPIRLISRTAVPNCQCDGPTGQAAECGRDHTRSTTQAGRPRTGPKPRSRKPLGTSHVPAVNR